MKKWKDDKEIKACEKLEKEYFKKNEIANSDDQDKVRKEMESCKKV
jgi:hypothetical protein